MNKMRIIVLLSLLLLISLSCTDERTQENSVFVYQNSVDIEYGSDICSFTGQPIETVRYGGKITMENGNEYKFMSAECVAGFVLNLADRSEIAFIQIVDFAHGQQYLPVDQLVFLRSSLRPSPNGLFLTAVDKFNTRMVGYIYDAYPGEYLDWDEVLDLVDREWNI